MRYGYLQVVYTWLRSRVSECSTQERDVGLFVVSNLLVTAASERRETRICKSLGVEFCETSLIEGIFQMFQGESKVKNGYVYNKRVSRRRIEGMLSVDEPLIVVARLVTGSPETPIVAMARAARVAVFMVNGDIVSCGSEFVDQKTGRV